MSGKKEIRAAFFDIDGTLIPFGDEDFPDSTRRALEKLKEKGIRVFIATGRPVKNMRHILELFDFDGYLALNGQYCVVDGKVIRDVTMDKAALKQLIPYIQEKQITCKFAEFDYLYVNCISDSYRRRMLSVGSTADPVENMNRLEKHALYQLMAYIDEEEEPEFFAHFPGHKSARWNPVFTDVIPMDGGKQVGMDAMADYLGITTDQTIAFGDGGNDIDMLRHAGIGVAMGNANDKVKTAADYVTEHTARDGIWLALKSLEVI